MRTAAITVLVLGMIGPGPGGARPAHTEEYLYRKAGPDRTTFQAVAERMRFASVVQNGAASDQTTDRICACVGVWMADNMTMTIARGMYEQGSGSVHPTTASQALRDDALAKCQWIVTGQK